MHLDLKETITKYHVGKIDQQLLLKSKTKHDYGKFTFQMVCVITLNKPRFDLAKDLNTHLKRGDTTTCWNIQKSQNGTISTRNGNP